MWPQTSVTLLIQWDSRGERSLPLCVRWKSSNPKRIIVHKSEHWLIGLTAFLSLCWHHHCVRLHIWSTRNGQVRRCFSFLSPSLLSFFYSLSPSLSLRISISISHSLLLSFSFSNILHTFFQFVFHNLCADGRACSLAVSPHTPTSLWRHHHRTSHLLWEVWAIRKEEGEGGGGGKDQTFPWAEWVCLRYHLQYREIPLEDFVTEVPSLFFLSFCCPLIPSQDELIHYGIARSDVSLFLLTVWSSHCHCADLSLWTYLFFNLIRSWQSLAFTHTAVRTLHISHSTYRPSTRYSRGLQICKKYKE